MTIIKQTSIRLILPLVFSLVFAACSSKKEESKSSEPAAPQNQEAPAPQESPQAIEARGANGTLRSSHPTNITSGNGMDRHETESHGPLAPVPTQPPAVALPPQTSQPQAQPQAQSRPRTQSRSRPRSPSPDAGHQGAQVPGTATAAVPATVIAPPLATSLNQSLERKVYGYFDFSGNGSNPCWGTEGQRPTASGQARRRAVFSCPDISVTLYCRRWSGVDRGNNIDLSYLEASVSNIQVKNPNFNAPADQICAHIIAEGNASGGSDRRAIVDGGVVARTLESISASRHPEDGTVAGLTLPSEFTFRDVLVNLIPKFDRNFLNLCTDIVHREATTRLSSHAATNWVVRVANGYCSRIAESWIIPQCVAPLFDHHQTCDSSCEGLWNSYLADRIGRNLDSNDWLQRSLRSTLEPLNASSEAARLVAKQDLLISVRSQSSCAANVRSDVESVIQSHRPSSASQQRRSRTN